MRRRFGIPLLAALVAAVSLAGGVSADAERGGPGRAVVEQRGRVLHGGEPLRFAAVTVYVAGHRADRRAKALSSTRSNADGRFEIDYRPPKDPDAVLYLVAERRVDDHRKGHHPERHDRRAALRQAVVLPATPRPSAASWSAHRPSPVTVNERTTVATAYAMAQFIRGRHIAGSYPGLQNAAATSHNLADPYTGRVAGVLRTPPNGLLTSTMRTFNSLANLVAGCTDRRSCAQLFRLARPVDGRRPSDTLQAMVNIAHAPAVRAQRLFDLSLASTPYAPVLRNAPDAWTLAVRYDGNGAEIDGPGNIAFDEDGNAWIANNYVFTPDASTDACGGRQALKLTPTGDDAPGAPFGGGGLYGAGYGITVDPKGDVWVSNFGFQGDECPLDNSRLYRSVSQFSADGEALSPPRGWRYGDISRPQGTVSDRDGNIWIANCGNRTVTRIPEGIPRRAQNIAPGSDRLIAPFDVAIDTIGRAWVTSNNTNSVLQVSPQGRPVRSVTTGGLTAPMGIASDSRGNLWVSNSGVIDPPCEGSTLREILELEFTQDSIADASVTLIRPDGTTPRRGFQGGGLRVPWGIAVDGDDNIWVANFDGNRLSQLCGARTSACPPGHRTGQPISPETGYSSDALVRNTGVQVDPSGNVWLVNNWLDIPVQTNPGGHEVVVFVGMAAPVRTPLIGPPRRP